MINIAKILKNAPQGLKLYSLVHGEVTLDDVADEYQEEDYHISVNTKDNDWEIFTKYGEMYCDFDDDECVLFPSKEHKSWDSWQEVLFKKGDIIVSIDKVPILYYEDKGSEYSVYNKYGERLGKTLSYLFNCRYATPEEREQFMAELNANGYKWNTNTKQIEKIEQQYTPKFKVNEHIIGDDFEIYKVINIKNLTYTLYSYTTHSNFEQTIKRIDENYKIVNEQELIDAGIKERPLTIDNFKPFDKVLIRNSKFQEWSAGIFSHIRRYTTKIKKAIIVGGREEDYCIPYNNETAHLLGTTEDCPDKYKTW